MSDSGGRRIVASWRGRVPYAVALGWQRDAARARASGGETDRLLLLEHDHVITIGRASGAGHVLLSPERAREMGIEIVESDRGGDVTYHGPGQLVGYPILQLPPSRRDLHRYLRDLEQALIDTLAEFGVAAGRSAAKTGVWVGDEKVASIGVRVSRWVTSHGFALNVTTDLSRFRWIVPCGIDGCRVSSLQTLIGRPVPLPEVASVAARCLAERFGLELTFENEGARRPEAACHR